MNAACLTRLKLTDFRNYRQLDLDLDRRHVVLTGENGAGKTNLMEAVSLLTPGRGLRRAAYPDMCREGAGAGFTVFAALDGMQGPVEIGTSAGGDPENGGSGRRLRINGTNARSNDELLEHLRIVWLTPAMDGLFTGPASDRRRFLDRQVLAIDPGHGKRVLDYERAMRSRNRLLSEGRLDPSWLSGIEVQMAEFGIAIALARRELIAMLTGLIDDRQDDGPFPRAGLQLEDFLSGIPGENAAEQEEALAVQLAASRDRDAAAGRTLTGPHRSDLMVRHRGKDMDAARCSTGEQKALLVGLVLAHARLTGEICGHAPVLLLDEIAAHLDEGRRAALFDLVDALGGQAFMTGTDSAMFKALGSRAEFLAVDSGTVARATADAQEMPVKSQ
ncbi:DNA replication/repair protein RecF [Hoeflea sp. E7-10]|uniref:DNA replication and repair protein RecF n=1 Tax=Hoeflea poritis TaxID=2993659 RepID=A0ABT4VNR3_9HYPH|nr:DNA replication/repair protein RecF [Hoeflea poritis]MDA4846358.1 DNA replication/repair protein RecF [Hoeflea poritis]